MQICKLCLEKHGKLHQKSHILPKWVYKYTQPDNHLDGKLRAYKGNGDYTNLPIGVHDKNILCNRCEFLIGELDNIGKIFFVDNELNIRITDDPEVLYVESDFEDIKLLRQFIFSLAFRIAITNHKRYFPINLNRNIINLFRGRTLNDQGDRLIFLTKFQKINEKNTQDKLLLIPTIGKIDSNSYLKIYLTRGLIANIKLGNSEEPSLDQFNLESNIIRILLTNPYKDINFRTFIESVVNTTNL